MNVKNRKCIRKLSWRSLWASRKRNIIAIIAIALTALLFTSLFTIVMSINSSYEMYTFRQVGGYCHGTFKEVTEEQIENISAHSNVKAAGKRITIGYMNSGIFAKTPAEVSFMDDNCTEWSFAEPTTGHAPQGRKEITMDTHALKLLGVEPEVGAEIELTYTVGALSEIPYEKTDTFTLAGWWEYDDISPVHYINISEEYAKEMETEAISKGLDPKMSFKIMEKVRKGKVKKGGFDEGWEDAMREHEVPEWYIESLAKIGYLFPKAHAVAYVMMAFRIAWYKVHEPLAFYATFFSVRAKAFDAEYCCAGMAAVKKKIREIENNKDATAVEQNLLTTLEVCYEFYLRGFHFDTINIYKSDATKFIVTENGLLPPFVTVHGLGEAAAIDTVEKRKGKEFISIEEFSMCCNKLSKTHIEQLKALGAFAGMADTSQITLF